MRRAISTTITKNILECCDDAFTNLWYKPWLKSLVLLNFDEFERFFICFCKSDVGAIRQCCITTKYIFLNDICKYILLNYIQRRTWFFIWLKKTSMTLRLMYTHWSGWVWTLNWEIFIVTKGLGFIILVKLGYMFENIKHAFSDSMVEK
jgi:hypothetical protein